MKSIYLRRAGVIELLAEYGISGRAAREMIESGAIKKLKLPGKESGYALYSRAQIERDVVGSMELVACEA